MGLKNFYWSIEVQTDYFLFVVSRGKMASSTVSKACKVKRLHLCIKFIKTRQFVT